MSLVGTSWASNKTGYLIKIVSDEGNWVGAKEDESGATNSLTGSR